jgi:hypothetical protein
LQQAKRRAHPGAKLLAAAAVSTLVMGLSSTRTASAQDSSSPNGAGTAAARTADSVAGTPGLPTGVPPAATAPPVALPEPTSTVWPFPSDFSQTEGTGRLAGGAYLWTDFVYDDHGAGDNPANQSSSSGLAPDHGGYTYPSGSGYDGNNADIFRAAVAYGRSDTFWRIDWNSLPDPSAPIAEWTMRAAGAAAPATQWPAGAGLTTSSGIEYALVVTSAQAVLIDASTGRTLGRFRTQVDVAARSFVVEIPTSTLPVSGKWSVQLAAGLADRSSSSPHFAVVGPANGGLPNGGGANVYNITFRTFRQESPLVCPDTPVDPGLVAQLQAGLATNSTTAGVPTAECGNFGWRTTKPTL